MELVIEYLVNVLEGFHNDPADTVYQKGYEAAVVEMFKVIVELEAK